MDDLASSVGSSTELLTKAQLCEVAAMRTTSKEQKVSQTQGNMEAESRASQGKTSLGLDLVPQQGCCSG